MGVMIHPERVPCRHAVFASGDDSEAKKHVAGMLESFGRPPDSVVDARGERLFSISIAAPSG
jgi:8-hydroxy-5-deazaflavin:NADPH oxidoreductase